MMLTPSTVPKFQSARKKNTKTEKMNGSNQKLFDLNESRNQKKICQSKTRIYMKSIQNLAKTVNIAEQKKSKHKLRKVHFNNGFSPLTNEALEEV